MPPRRDSVPVQSNEFVELAVDSLPPISNSIVETSTCATNTTTNISTSSISSVSSITPLHQPCSSKQCASSFSPASVTEMEADNSDAETEMGGMGAVPLCAQRVSTPSTEPDMATMMTRNQSVSSADLSMATSVLDGWRGELPASSLHANVLSPASAGDGFVEPILSPTQDRFVLFPIQHNDLWEMYQKHFSCLWRTEEIDLSNDLKHWTAMTDNERYFISMILAFFAASDGIVIENLAARFTSEIQLPEARAFYAIQTLMETVHSHTYSVLIDKYAANAQEKDTLFHAVTQFPCIQKKADWALRWISDKQSQFAKRLVAFACVEGIFFSGAFCSIFWLKKRGLMPGLTFSNELISRDEALHCEFAIMLYSKLERPLTTAELHEIVREAVSIEIEFICDALPCNLIGMNAKLMSQYIEYVADRLCMQFGQPAIYGTSNPFDFMELISLDGKTNFFERKVGEYALSTKGNFDEDLDFEAEF